jgi:hypothetical protein
MKKITYIILTVSCSLIIVSCFNNKNNDDITTDLVKNPNTASGKVSNQNLPKFQFKEETHDFGKIIQGEKVIYPFIFENTGKSDLLISNATASCGCTVADYPKKPLHPGEKGKITISFNTEGKNGVQAKTITLIANTQPNTKVLTIKAEVYKPEKN